MRNNKKSWEKLDNALSIWAERKRSFEDEMLQNFIAKERLGERRKSNGASGLAGRAHSGPARRHSEEVQKRNTTT